jgi:hypothetical protein
VTASLPESHHDGLVPSRAVRRRVKAAARGPGPGRPLATGRPRLVLPCQVLAGFSESGARPGLPGGGVTVPPPVKTVKPEPTGPAAHHPSQQNAPCIIIRVGRVAPSRAAATHDSATRLKRATGDSATRRLGPFPGIYPALVRPAHAVLQTLCESV